MSDPRWFIYTAEEMLHLKRSCELARVMKHSNATNESLALAMRGIADEPADQYECGGMLWGEELP